MRLKACWTAQWVCRGLCQDAEALHHIHLALCKQAQAEVWFVTGCALRQRCAGQYRSGSRSTTKPVLAYLAATALPPLAVAHRRSSSRRTRCSCTSGHELSLLQLPYELRLQAEFCHLIH